MFDLAGIGFFLSFFLWVPVCIKKRNILSVAAICLFFYSFYLIYVGITIPAPVLSSPSFICVINSPRSSSFSFRITFENHVIHSFKSLVCISSAMPSVQSCLSVSCQPRNLSIVIIVSQFLLCFNQQMLYDIFPPINPTQSLFLSKKLSKKASVKYCA